MTDVFQTAIASCSILYNFACSCAEFSSSAKRLSVELQWDILLLRRLLDTLDKRELIPTAAQDSGGSSSQQQQGAPGGGNQDLLDQAFEHLGDLLTRANASAAKISAKSWWRKGINRATWWHYKAEFESLERELRTWVERFGIRLIALPRSLTTVFQHVEANANAAEPPPVLEVQRIIRRVLNVADDELLSKGQELLIERSSDRLQLELQGEKVNNRVVAHLDRRFAVVEYRQMNGPAHQYETLRQEFRNDQLRLAALLSLIEPLSTGILRCSALYPEDTNFGRPQFGFTYHAPFEPREKTKTVSLKSLLETKIAHGDRSQAKPAHSLSQRFLVASQMAKAILFIHSVGWVHKSIDSRNFLFFERDSATEKEAFPWALGQPFLAGFESARPSEGFSDESTRSAPVPWSVSVYRHPRRQGAKIDTRFARSHDIYSFGVVLLELGVWKPIETYEKHIKRTVGGTRSALLELADILPITMGDTYKEVVKWCLSRDEERGGVDVFLKNVVEKLESLASTV